eukprot:4650097-Pyramimonas_sp.AAC.1
MFTFSVGDLFGACARQLSRSLAMKDTSKHVHLEGSVGDAARAASEEIRLSGHGANIGSIRQDSSARAPLKSSPRGVWA